MDVEKHATSEAENGGRAEDAPAIVPRDTAEAKTSVPSTPGAIPFLLRIGVTGHRRLPDDPALAEQVARAVQRIQDVLPYSAYTPLRLVAVSPLAEGADRLVAHEVLRDPNATLEVPLPLPRDDYVEDFPDTRGEFDDLLSQASVVTTLPQCDTRDEAYEQVGLYVLERCDVLIALWDGEGSHGQGGTHEILKEACRHAVPFLWIHTKPPFRTREFLAGEVPQKEYPTFEELDPDGVITVDRRAVARNVKRLLDEFAKLDTYNRLSVSPRDVDEEIDNQRAGLLRKADEAGLNAHTVHSLCSWLLPPFVRADLSALQVQSSFFRWGTLVPALPALAVCFAAFQIFLEHPSNSARALTVVLSIAEILCLVGTILILIFGRSKRHHEWWIAGRFLAEHLRARLFLVLTGEAESVEGAPDYAYLGHRSPRWLRRALDAVWSQRPLVSAPSSPDALKRFLVTAWIEDQLTFHMKRRDRNHRATWRITGVTGGIFLITVVVAILHPLPHMPSQTLLWVVIAFPALGSAFQALAGQREYERNASRYGQMADSLKRMKESMEDARGLLQIRRIARDTEGLMLSENREWFLIMQAHDFELP